MISSLLLLTKAVLLVSGTAYAEQASEQIRLGNPSSPLEGIGSITTCGGCYSALLSLKATALLGDKFFVRRLTTICKLANIEDDDVCEGAIALEAPIIAHDLREMTIPSHTSQLFCTTFFGVCDMPKVRPYNVTFPKGKPERTRPSVSGESPITFVHFSDIHVDHQYETGSNYNCTKPICCRPYTYEESPGNTEFPAGPYGDHACDSPKRLEQSMFSAIAKIAPDAAFALFTGDIPEHAVWQINKSSVSFGIKDAYEDMDELLPMPVYATLGNHESAPVNSFPPRKTKGALSSQWIYDLVSRAWKQWIGKDARVAGHQHGAYTHRVPGLNLRVISLNGNYHYKVNPWIYQREMEYDPNGQLAWLVKQLQSAEDAGERVYIMAHQPFGVNDALHDQSNYLNQIVNRYDATIAAMFFGHTHKDHFQISYSNYSDRSHRTATMMSYISPSLTPTSGSPAFRVFTVDPVTLGILDYTVYSASLEALTYQTAGPVWKEYYSARESYGSLLNITSTTNSSELTPAFWHNVTLAFERDDTAFRAFYARKSREWNVGNCTDECKRDEICQLRAAEAQFNCISPSPGLKVLEDEQRARDDCHSSRLLGVLGSLRGKQAVLETMEMEREV